MIEQVNQIKWAIKAVGTGKRCTAFLKDLVVVKPIDVVEWEVIQDPNFSRVPEQYKSIGLIGFDFGMFNKDSIDVNNIDYKNPFGELFQKLWPGDVVDQINNMNRHINQNNKKMSASVRDGNRMEWREVKHVSEREFWTFIGIILSAAAEGKGDYNLWEKMKNRDNRTFSMPTDLGPSGRDVMPEYRFRQILSAFEVAFDDGSEDNWARIGKLIDGFNNNRKLNLDESMSAFVPRTSRTGGLPHLSFIKRKPEPLGTELKVSFVIKQTFLFNPFILVLIYIKKKHR